MPRREQWSVSILTFFGDVVQGAPGVYKFMDNQYGHIYFCRGLAANLPSGTAGYAVGCLYFATDTGAVYVNQGTTASCSFQTIGTLAAKSVVAGDIALADAKILVGGSGGAAAAQSVSGDLSMADTGGFTIVQGAVNQVKQYVRSAMAVNSTGTISAAALVGGIITSTTVAAVTGTTDTAANILAALPNAAIGTAFEFSVVNTGGSNAFTFAAHAGDSLVGSGTVAAGASGRFVGVFTAVGGSPAITYYRLS